MSNAAGVDPLLLRQLTQSVDQRAAGVVAERGLSVDQWRMIEYLAVDGADTMAGLTTAVGLTAPTATRVADRLVEWALVYRDVDETDRRRVVLRISRRGAALYDALAESVGRVQDEALAGLTAREHERLAELVRRAAAGVQPSGVR